ncbi:UNVERIFIED_CONTAM: hypothetical protein FKN15_073460 [Acipenser sinensis]
MSGEKCCSASTARQRRSVSQHHPLGAYPRNRADPGVYKNKPVAGEVSGFSPLEMEKNMDAQQPQIGTSKSEVRSEMRPKREVPSLYLGFRKAKTSPEQQGQYNTEDNHPHSSETTTAVESQAAVTGPFGVLGDRKEKTNTDPLAHTAKPEQHPKSLYRTGKKRLPRNTRIPHSRRPRSLVGEFVKNELQGYPKSRVLTHRGQQALRLTDYSAEKEVYSREHEESFVHSSEYWGPDSSAGSQRHLTTMYFSGKKEQVKLHPTSELELPRSEFTVELWVKPEGGQSNPAIIAGPPDVDEPCEPSLQAWSPELHLYDANMTVPCPQPQGCALELNFLHPVIAESLSVWITYISTDSSSAISNIEVLTDEGGPLQLGPLHTFCDVPLTLRINTRKKVTGVKIYTLDEKMEIDAVLLSSRTRDPLCSSCRPLRYRLLREPSFPQGPVTQTERTFTDIDVSPGQVYRYSVQVEAEQALSVPSPVLPYVHGAPYCGDGQLQRMRGEECDDGNLLDGDGCSKKCYKEAGFNCKGEPSQCYVFDGDGLCEEFERGSSVQDCGVFTPQGFTDQWAAKAFASHQDDTKCPVLAVKGEPSLNQVYFAHPEVATSVIIYLASDGSMLGDQSRKTVVIQLGDTNGKNYTLGSYQLSCQRNPLVINMTHNLSLPFFRTASVLLNFSSPLVAVSGIALRTSSHISALALNGCVRRSCSADKCSSPQIRQASVNCTHEEAQHLKCTIACNQGLTLQVVGGINLHPSQKETVLECMHGKWDRMVTCEPIDCGVPDQSHVYFASFSCPEGTMFGKQCSFSCNSPAKLQGGKDWLVCQEDGLWSFPEAYCKLECTAPSALPNAKLLVPRCQLGGHDVGSICRYMCNPGYYVTGSPNKMPRKRFLKIACLEGGLWEEGGCTPVVCTPPSLVFEGMYSCTNGLEFDSQCTLNCPDSSERHTIRCTKEGKWTDEFKLCKKLQGVCPPPPELNLVEYSCEQGYSVAAVCYPLCVISLSDPVILPNNITADTMSHWMEPTQVEHTIRCTKEGKWTDEFKLCKKLQGVCPPPPELNLVEYSCEQGYSVAAVCYPLCVISLSDPVILPNNITADTMSHWMEPTQVENMTGSYSCEQGYSVAAVCYPLCVISLSDPVILPNNITADTMSHWMEPTQVESIVCTGLMRWHPDPNLIHCIQSCENMDMYSYGQKFYITYTF